MLADEDTRTAPANTEAKTAFPRLTRGSGSGAIFYMTSATEGVAITHGSDCFMEKGTKVGSMDGMLPHEDPELLQKAVAGIL